MENAQTILVIFLASALTIFLVLGIVLLAICIKIANHIKHISEKAEQITDRAEDIADFFGKAATPLAMGKIIAKVADIIKSRHGKRGK
jgi:hypothetical protein